MKQLALEQTALEHAIEAAVATGAMPSWWMGWQRNDPKGAKPQPLEELVQDGLDRFAAKCGAAADTVVCAPQNVERLTPHFPHLIIRTMTQVWHSDVIYLGRSGSERCGK